MSTAEPDTANRQKQQRVTGSARKQSAATDGKRVAIVHDWLIGGGGEKVVLELHKLYPDAPIYTSYAIDEWRMKLDQKVITGPLQAWPFSKLRKFIPMLRIWWFQSLKFDNYDLVLRPKESKHQKTSSILIIAMRLRIIIGAATKNT
jgi:hypothetical protein